MMFFSRIIRGCFIFFLALSVSAQQHQKTEKEEYLQKLKKQQIAQLNLRNLTSMQKKHLRLFMEAYEELRKEKHDMKRVYVLQFKPVAEATALQKKILLNTCVKCERLSLRLMEQGNERGAEIREQMARKYKALAEAAEAIEKTYKTNCFGKMYEAIDQYVDLELEMRAYKLKIPKREWLTNREAAKLVSDWYKIKKSKKR